MHTFNLIENAKDSLLHAIGHMGPVNSNSPGDWKRIIVDLAHVLELLLKEKLRQIHPAFLFQNVDKYSSANAFTLSAEFAVERLKKIGLIVFTKDDLKAICSTREKRNEIEHYEFSLENHEARVLVGQALGFILKFSEMELNLDWKSLCFKNNNWKILYQYQEFYETLLNTTNAKIEKEETPVLECPSCHNETFGIEKECCLLCGHKETIMDCVSCKSPFLYSVVEYEGAKLCLKCQYDEGYAEANFEKY